LARVPHAPASGRCPCHSSGTCDAAWWPNLIIRRLPGYTVMPSSTCCGTCKLIIVGLPRVIDFFFFLFSLLITKVHNYPLRLLSFNFSHHSLNFSFHPYSFYKSFVFFFLILSFNHNFLYVLFFISVLILLISYFIPFIVLVLLNPSYFLLVFHNPSSLF